MPPRRLGPGAARGLGVVLASAVLGCPRSPPDDVTSGEPVPASAQDPRTTGRASEPPEAGPPPPTPATGEARAASTEARCARELAGTGARLTACTPGFQARLARLDALISARSPEAADFVLPSGLEIRNVHEVSPADPDGQPTTTLTTVPRAAFVDGSAQDELADAATSGLRCTEVDEVWCPDFDCRRLGSDVVCGSFARDPIAYRWERTGDRWSLAAITYTWLY